MAHFAELDENNQVLRTVVVRNEDILDENNIEYEIIGIVHLKNLFGDHTNWKQTSYNNNMRGLYAAKGMLYNEEIDAFIHPQPYDSWTLSSITKSWEPPIPEPEMTIDELDSGRVYTWNEEMYQSGDTINCWELSEPEILDLEALREERRIAGISS